jgi:hypothetical protein
MTVPTATSAPASPSLLKGPAQGAASILADNSRHSSGTTSITVRKLEFDKGRRLRSLKTLCPSGDIPIELCR